MRAVVSIKSLHSLQWFPIVSKIKALLFKAPLSQRSLFCHLSSYSLDRTSGSSGPVSANRPNPTFLTHLPTQTYWQDSTKPLTECPWGQTLQ